MKWRSNLVHRFSTKTRLAQAIIVAALLTAAPTHVYSQPKPQPSAGLGQRQSAEEVLKEGVRKAAEGDYEKAIADYNQALTIDPQQATAYFYRGVARAHLGQGPGASGDFDQVLRLRIEKLTKTLRAHRRNALAYIQRGHARSEYRDQPGAIKDYDQAIRLDPRNADAYFLRGNAYYKQSEKSAAIKDYDRALQIDPKRADVYVIRAAVRLELGDKGGAVEDFGKARRINPDDQVH